MRSDLIGAPIVDCFNKIFIIRATWVAADGKKLILLIEDEHGNLRTCSHDDGVAMLVPQVMSSYSATSLTELFPDLLMPFGRREIVAIWTLSLGFDGPLREKIKYGIVAFKEGKENELAAMRAALTRSRNRRN